MPFHKGISNKYQYQINTNIKSGIRHWTFDIRNWKLKHAFTLIELLLVIALIGILSSFGVYGYQSSQIKARDTQRKSDLDAIKKALEAYSNDTSGAAWYPNALIYALAQLNYIQTLPKDPKTGSDYIYTPSTINLTPCVPLMNWWLDDPIDANLRQCAKYTLSACLENNNDTGKNTLTVGASPDGSSCPASTQRIYQVTSD